MKLVRRLTSIVCQNSECVWCFTSVLHTYYSVYELQMFKYLAKSNYDPCIMNFVQREYCVWNTYNILRSLICIFMTYSTSHATLTIFWLHQMHNVCLYMCMYVWCFKWHLAGRYLCHIIFLSCLLNLKLNINTITLSL